MRHKQMEIKIESLSLDKKNSGKTTTILFVLVICSSSSSSSRRKRRKRRRRHLPALFAQFAHNLRDVDGGGHLGLLLLLHLPEDDGTQTGPAVLRILLKLGLTGGGWGGEWGGHRGRKRKTTERRVYSQTKQSMKV